eukprot:5507722-Prymnesium_polylepis.2
MPECPAGNRACWRATVELVREDGSQWAFGDSACDRATRGTLAAHDASPAVRKCSIRHASY